MKKKHLIIQLLILFIFNAISGQVVNSYYNSNYYGAIYIPSGNTNIILDLSSVKGSPYENDKFQIGKVKNKLSGESHPFYMRYNIFNDVIELKEDTKSTKITGLIKSLNIFVNLNNKEIHYETYTDNHSNNEEGYFILLKRGSNINLYLKKNKKFKDKIIAQDSYHKEKPATFKDSDKYYFKKGKSLVLLSSKKKDLINQFPGNESELKKYIKSEKIDLKSEKDVIKLFNYLDTVLK